MPILLLSHMPVSSVKITQSLPNYATNLACSLVVYLSKTPFDLLSCLQAPILKDIFLLSQMNRATLAYELSPDKYQKGEKIQAEYLLKVKVLIKKIPKEADIARRTVDKLRTKGTSKKERIWPQKNSQPKSKK